MKKHAYLIIAHTEFELLAKLLAELDDERNDIFLHVDKKVKNYPKQLLVDCVSKAKLIFVRRRRVYWGTLSQVVCTVSLLKSALQKGEYHYYHLLSGMDYPIKTQDEIHAFFEDKNMEYISWHTDDCGDDFNYKIQYFYPFLGLRVKRSRTAYGVWNRCEDLFIKLQRKLNIDRRNGKTFRYYKGDNWFSIENDFAKYILQKKNLLWMIRNFYWCNGSDEFVLQTLAMNSEYRDRVYNDSLRMIDWDRGFPYEYSMKDAQEVRESDKFWMRKVSLQHDPGFVEWLSKRLAKRNDNGEDEGY